MLQFFEIPLPSLDWVLQATFVCLLLKLGDKNLLDIRKSNRVPRPFSMGNNVSQWKKKKNPNRLETDYYGYFVSLLVDSKAIG